MRFLHLILMLVLTAGPAAAAATAVAPGWEKSVVKVEVSRNIYDYYQPWNRRNDRSTKIGIVVGEHQVLTTSQDMSEALHPASV